MGEETDDGWVRCRGCGRFTWFWSRLDEREADGVRLLDPHLTRTVPWHGIVVRVLVLVQRFFLLDTDRLRADRLWWLRKVFPEAFVALTVYLVTDGLPHLHQGTGKI